MADVMVGSGRAPYLQFGEVQWWYFADGAGMPFYDEYTASDVPSDVRHADANDPERARGPGVISSGMRIAAQANRRVYDCGDGSRPGRPRGCSFRSAVPARHERHAAMPR